jgi:hypothetical protein
MSGWRSRVLALGLGLAVTLLLLGVAELAVRKLWRPPAGPRTDYEPGYWARDERGRGHPAAPGAWRSWEIDPKTGATLYDVVYHVDDHLRRVTPLLPEGPRDRFALLFSDSFTFGEGVGDDQTAPYRLGVLAPRYHPLNYGFHAGGPSDMLSWLEAGSPRDEVDESRGILIYTFIDDHVRRTIGTLRLIASWGRGMPCYELNDSGVVEFRGTFERARPVRDLVFRRLGSSVLLERLGLDWPLRIGDAEIETTARVLARSKEVFDSHFPGSRFVVVLYPGTDEFGPRLLSDLARLGVETLDLSRLFDTSQTEYVLSRLDPHPSPLAYRKYAEALVERLGLNREPPP